MQPTGWKAVGEQDNQSLEASVLGYLLHREGKGTSKCRNLADKPFLNQVIKLTSAVSYAEGRRHATSQLVFLLKPFYLNLIISKQSHLQ